MTLSLVETGACDIRRCTVLPGDVIVLTCERTLNTNQCEHLRDNFRQSVRMPDIPVLVLHGGVSLQVMGAQQAEAMTADQDFWCSYPSVKRALEHAAQAGPGGMQAALRMLEMWGDRT